jgi:hypothetical protein
MLLIERKGFYRFVYDFASDRYKVLYSDDSAVFESNIKSAAQVAFESLS